jgi:hypothetical protein
MKEARDLAGRDDWRLPSAVELQSIVDYGHSAPSIDSTVFPNTPAAVFWTSTAMVNPVLSGKWIGSKVSDAQSLAVNKAELYRRDLGA